mgnify:FL=1
MTRRKCKKCNGDMEYCKMGKGSYTPIFILTGVFMMCIPILGWIGALICFILAILMLFVPTHYFAKCIRCGNFVRITKEEYKKVTR